MKKIHEIAFFTAIAGLAESVCAMLVAIMAPFWLVRGCDAGVLTESDAIGYYSTFTDSLPVLAIGGICVMVIGFTIETIVFRAMTKKEKS